LPALQLPKLRPDQLRIAEALNDADTVCLAMGRRWGKSTLGLVLEATFAARGGRCAWIVPTYKNGYPLWSMLKNAFAELRSIEAVRIWENDRRLEVDPRHGGGYIGMYTGEDDCASIRGDAFDLAIVDEAAKVTETAVYDAILPTLADRSGKLMPISTPWGRNWFWRMWQVGQDEAQREIRSFTAPSSANPMPQIRRAYHLAKEQVSERTFRQEWDAEFVDDSGGVFRNVRMCHAGSLEDAPANWGRQYVVGVDLAKMEDYTVCIVADLKEQRIVAMDRFNRASWPLQKERIARLAQDWNNAQVILDATGLGDPIYDDLQRGGLNVLPYKLTHATKSALIDNAVLMVEQQQVHFPASLTTLTNELESYEYERTPAGVIRMNAPQGMHDDCVIAFALACWGLGHGGSVRIAQAVIEQLRAKPEDRPFGGVSLMKRSL
jgi:hypothetical protein